MVDSLHKGLWPTPSWVERSGVPHWIPAMIWIVLVFVLFQMTAAIVTVLLLIYEGGEITHYEALSERLDLLFMGNSAGQILFLLLATILVAGLHTGRRGRSAFLRLRTRPGTGTMTLYSVLLFIVVQPLIMLLGFLNNLFPVPDYLTEMQDMQYEMIENFLTSEGALLTGLFHIALVPAVCEEVMFRGYVLRAFEKQWGVWSAILVSGVIFGLFHLQLSNLLPLAALGILLALVTWLSGSLVPAMAAHFVNNGAAVVLGNHYPEMAFSQVTVENLPPFWILLMSALLSGFLLRQLYRNREQAVDQPPYQTGE